MLKRDVIIFADADNTLWDTDGVFADAQLLALQLVEEGVGLQCTVPNRLGFIREYDQALAQVHHLHLRYPPILLVFALVAGLRGANSDVAAQVAMSGGNFGDGVSLSFAEEVVRRYEGALGAVPQLLPGVQEGVALASERGLTLNVLTEGRIEKQRRILAHHHLDKFINEIFEVAKVTKQFERLRQRFTSAELVVIGDQFDRDIQPALMAGCFAIYVPGRFNPKWNLDIDLTLPTYTAHSFLDAVNWIVTRVQ